MIWPLLLALLQVSFPAKPVRKTAAKAEIVFHDRVWDHAPHNAFTDLTRFGDRWYLVFREGASHVSDDGAIRVLSAQSWDRWEDHGRLTYPSADLRDPKIVVAGNRLMLTAAGHMHSSSAARFKNFVWHSRDGRNWGSPREIGDPEIWLWRVQWHQGKGYGFGYATAEPRLLRSYITTDGEQFRVLNPTVLDKDYVNESSIVFLPDDTAVCLLRRDPKTALLGTSRPPYRGWTWEDLGVRVGGPHLALLPDGRIVAAVRLLDGDKRRTSLCWVNREEHKLDEFLTLPSGGDTSYAGLVFHDGLLHVSYYSSHEQRTSIYLAKVKLP